MNKIPTFTTQLSNTLMHTSQWTLLNASQKRAIALHQTSFRTRPMALGPSWHFEVSDLYVDRDRTTPLRVHWQRCKVEVLLMRWRADSLKQIPPSRARELIGQCSLSFGSILKNQFSWNPAWSQLQKKLRNATLWATRGEQPAIITKVSFNTKFTDKIQTI